jgi:hypothetical protein
MLSAVVGVEQEGKQAVRLTGGCNPGRHGTGQGAVTMIYGLRVASLLFAALALAPAGAHLFSIASKLRLDADDYLVSQRAYDGWNLFAVVVIGALLSTLVLSLALWRADRSWTSAALAFACLAGTQIIFWSFTFPANAATENWTILPEGWEMWRARWEYSHAASAILNAATLLLLVFDSTKP